MIGGRGGRLWLKKNLSSGRGSWYAHHMPWISSMVHILGGSSFTMYFS